MFSQYFGQYLLNRELISREQLTIALNDQQSVHVKFGVIAVDEGFMTASQVEEVHEKQKQVDKRFGEIAIDFGYLTTNQVEALVANQKQNHLFLAQAIIDRAYMTIEQFGEALKAYKKEHSLSNDRFEAMKRGNIELLVENILEGQDEKERYGEYLSLFAKNMIRFIDDHVYIEVAGQEVTQPDAWVIHQEISGKSPLFTGMTMTDEVLLQIASIHAEEELTEVDELAQASVCEFLNLHNGIYLVNMSNMGIELAMKPQEIHRSAKVTGEVFIVTVHTSKGSFQLFLSDQPANNLIK